MDDRDRAVRAHVIVHGRVQGVWYRGSACEQAQSLGVTGWVRNRWDGKVEAVMEGPRADVSRMVAWCHRGPRLAEVERIELEWQDATGEFAGFTVAR